MPTNSLPSFYVNLKKGQSQNKFLGKIRVLAVFEYSILHREFTNQVLPPN